MDKTGQKVLSYSVAAALLFNVKKLKPSASEQCLNYERGRLLQLIVNMHHMTRT